MCSAHAAQCFWSCCQAWSRLSHCISKSRTSSCNVVLSSGGTGSSMAAKTHCTASNRSGGCSQGAEWTVASS